MVEELEGATPWQVSYEQSNRVEHGGLLEIAKGLSWDKAGRTTLLVTRLVGERMRVERHPEHDGLEFDTPDRARAYAEEHGLIRRPVVFRFTERDRNRVGEYMTALIFGAVPGENGPEEDWE